MKSIRWYVYCEEEKPLPQYSITDIFYWQPQIVKVELRDGKWIDSSEPAFVGYIFIGSPRGWRYIEEILIDVRLLRKGSEPYELTEKDLQSMKIFSDVQFNVAAFDIGVGKRVKVIKRSAFFGMEGRVIQKVPVIGGEQLCVEFELEKLKISRCIPLDHVEVLP